MKLLLLLALALAMCASATAAPVQSPRAASVPKFKPMFVPASEPPRLPMRVWAARVNSQYGAFELTAQALQPANYSLLFEVAPVNEPNAWEPLSWLGPYPEDQQVFTALYSNSETLFIRASIVFVPPSDLTRIHAAGSDMRIASGWSGLRVWRGKK